jgi:hypothetical protein
MLLSIAVSVGSLGKPATDVDVHRVLSVRMRNRANTWMPVS